MIRAIIFDIGGVIVTEEANRVILKTTKKFGIGRDDFNNATKIKFKETFTGKIDILDWYTDIVSRLEIDVDPKEMFKSHLETYKTITKKPNLDIINLVERLKDNYKIGCLSNIENQIAKYNLNRGLFDVFGDNVFLSCEMGIMKPNPEIFNIVLKKLGSVPEETIFIDDNPENIKAANKLGIHGILFKGYEQLIRDLDELGVNNS